jgi:hypothetical protein
MAVLNTVADYIAQARTILQDTTASAYRYSDNDLKEALGLAIYETRRIRPDLFLGHNTTTVPDIDSATTTNTPVTMDRQYRVALVHFMVGHVGKRDEEEASDRAGAFLNAYRTQLLSVG